MKHIYVSCLVLEILQVRVSTPRTMVVMFRKDQVVFFVGENNTNISFIGRIDELLRTKDSEVVHEPVTLMNAQSKSVAIQEIVLKLTQLLRRIQYTPIKYKKGKTEQNYLRDVNCDPSTNISTESTLYTVVFLEILSLEKENLYNVFVVKREMDIFQN